MGSEDERTFPGNQLGALRGIYGPRHLPHQPPLSERQPEFLGWIPCQSNKPAHLSVGSPGAMWKKWEARAWLVQVSRLDSEYFRFIPSCAPRVLAQRWLKYRCYCWCEATHSRLNLYLEMFPSFYLNPELVIIFIILNHFKKQYDILSLERNR